MSNKKVWKTGKWTYRKSTANDRSRDKGGGGSTLPELEKVRINKRLTYFARWVTTSGVH